MSIVHLGPRKDVVLKTGLDAHASQLHEVARSLNTFCHSERMNRPAEEKDIRAFSELLSRLEDSAKSIESHPELRGTPEHRALTKALGKNGGLLEAYVNHRVAPWMKHFAEENHEKSTFGKLKNAPTLFSMKKAIERIKNLDTTAGTILGAQAALPTAKNPALRPSAADLDAFLNTAPPLLASHSSAGMPSSMASLLQPTGVQAPMTPSLDPRLMLALLEALSLLPPASPLALAIQQALGPVAALQGDSALPSSLVDPAYYAQRLSQPKRARTANGSSDRGESDGRSIRPQRVTVPGEASPVNAAHRASEGIPLEKIPDAAHQHAKDLGWSLEPVKPGMSRRKDAADEKSRFPPEWDDLSMDRKIKLANSICMALEPPGAVVREVQTVRVRRFLFPETWDHPAKEGRPQIMAPAPADAAWAERMRAQDQKARQG